MLTKLLSRKTCAECRLCCVFESYDIWNTPLLTPEIRDKAKRILPDAQFLPKGENSYIFRIVPERNQEFFSCPLLDPQKGCMLDTEKPFTCQIWPFCIMELKGRQLISVAPFCEAVMQYSMGTLLKFLKSELAEKIFAYAEQYPDIVQPYDDLYPVLLWKPNQF